MGFTRSSYWFRFTLKASSKLHSAALWAVIQSPMTFFVANPTGRILNRFSRDQNLVDEMLATTSFAVLFIGGNIGMRVFAMDFHYDASSICIVLFTEKQIYCQFERN